jgi:type IV pilus assembly protein PilE
MKTRVRRGFTLPEVLVTVTVVAVLAAVVVPAVTQYVSRGNTPATQQDILQIQNAVNGYVADTRAYPGYLSELSAATGIAGFHGPYLAANTTGGVTGSTATSASSFTSQALGIIFADSIGKPSVSDGYLRLFVNSSTPCNRLLQLDTLYDSPSGLGGGSGRVIWDGTCAQGTATGTITATPGNAYFKFMAVGS